MNDRVEEYHDNGTLAELIIKNKAGLLDNKEGPAHQTWDQNGGEMSRLYYIGGQKHSLEGPADVFWNDRDVLEEKKYYINDKQLREEEFLARTDTADNTEINDPERKPRNNLDKMLIRNHTNGIPKEIIRFDEHGKFHSTEGPAIEEWYDNGQLKRVIYCIGGVPHRCNGPYEVEWYDNGQVKETMYRINGVGHNTKGPYYQSWYKNGQVHKKSYRINGEYVNVDGAAIWEWDSEGNLSNGKYFYNKEERHSQQFSEDPPVESKPNKEIKNG